MYRTLMTPLDGSVFSEYAIPLALTIARRADATLHLVHVGTAPVPPETFRRMQADGDDISLHAQGRLYLDQLADSLAARWQIPIVATVLDGPVVPTLDAYAREVCADLVVMTTHGRSALMRMALGSVADALVRALPVPVLLTRPRAEALDLLESVHEDACERILLPLDGSALAEEAIEPALALGMLFDAEYLLLQAIDPPLLDYALTPYAPVADQRTLDAWREAASAYLDRVAERLRARKLRVRTQVALGNPAAAIAETVRDQPCELIVLATHGRGGLARVVLGSTTDTVLHALHTPLLVVRPGTAVPEQTIADGPIAVGGTDRP
jgi:nucleotide-binding universal stress UspA family protein